MTAETGGPAPEGRPRVYFLASPCPKASVDMEKLSRLVAARGFPAAGSPEEAAVIVTWGCGFIDDAKQESIDDILSAVEVKKHGRARAVIVAGCLPEKYGDDLAESIPEVDAFVGASSLAMLPEVIARVLGGEEVRRVWLSRPFMDFEPGRDRDLVGGTGWTRTLLICRGCDNRCTYCAIPQMRGRLRSRAPDDILAEARDLVAAGAVELVLAGQDTASYGRDRGGPGLTALARRLAGESGARWIRLCYAHPDNLDAGIADVMAEHGNICRYIDLPIQHAAPAVLEAMGRNPDPDAIRAKIIRMRERVPDLAIRTSVIVGFPGESESDFEHLLKFLEEMEFDLIGVFEFSPQPGTIAERLPDRVPDFIRRERLMEIVRLQEEMAGARAAALVGKEIEVLVEERAGADVIGRSQYDAPDVDRRVRIADCGAEPGALVPARVTGYEAWGDLEAVVAASRRL